MRLDSNDTEMGEYQDKKVVISKVGGGYELARHEGSVFKGGSWSDGERSGKLSRVLL